jgi:Kinesin motor domain
MSTPLSPGGPNNAASVGGKQENVKVAIRVRPFNRREKDLGAKSVVEIGEEGKSITIIDPSSGSTSAGAAASAGQGSNKEKDDGKKTFFFDHVYGSETPQIDVYTQIAKPIVDQSLKGYNGTIFAYGQVSHQFSLDAVALLFPRLHFPSLFVTSLHVMSCRLGPARPFQ